MNFMSVGYQTFITLMRTFMGFFIFGVIVGILLIVLSAVLKRKGKNGKALKAIGAIAIVLCVVPLLFIVGDKIMNKFNHGSEFTSDTFSEKIVAAIKAKDSAKMTELFEGVSKEDADEFFSYIDGDITSIDEPQTDLRNDYGDDSVLDFVECDGTIENVVTANETYTIEYKADVYRRGGKECVKTLTLYDHIGSPIYELRSESEAK